MASTFQGGMWVVGRNCSCLGFGTHTPHHFPLRPMRLPPSSPPNRTLQIAGAVLDPLVFKEVSRAMLGDRIKFISSGAPAAMPVWQLSPGLNNWPIACHWRADVGGERSACLQPAVPMAGRAGGAPLAQHVEEFMRVCGCADFVQVRRPSCVSGAHVQRGCGCLLIVAHAKDSTLFCCILAPLHRLLCRATA